MSMNSPLILHWSVLSVMFYKCLWNEKIVGLPFLIFLVNSTLFQVCSPLWGISWQDAPCFVSLTSVLTLVNAELWLVIQRLLSKMFEDKGPALLTFSHFHSTNMYCTPTLSGPCAMVEVNKTDKEGKFLHSWNYINSIFNNTGFFF